MANNIFDYNNCYLTQAGSRDIGFYFPEITCRGELSSRQVDYIVIHYTAGMDAQPKSIITDWANRTTNRASAHFAVGRTETLQCVKLNNKAWHCGKNINGLNGATNQNTIGIELCSDKNNNIPAEVLNAGAELVAALFNYIGWTAADFNTHLVRHFEIHPTSCPGPLCNAQNWQVFKDNIAKAMNNITPSISADMTNGNYSTDAVPARGSAYTEGFYTLPGRIQIGWSPIAVDDLITAKHLNKLNDIIFHTALSPAQCLKCVSSCQANDQLIVDAEHPEGIPVTSNNVIGSVDLGLLSLAEYKSILNSTIVQKLIIGFFKEQGCNWTAISGILGNIEKECTWKPYLYNSIGAYGLFQQLKKDYTSITISNSIYKQLKYFMDSMSIGWLNKSYGSWESFKTQNNGPAYAAEWFCQSYERPGSQYIPPRRNAAEQLYSNNDLFQFFKTVDFTKFIEELAKETEEEIDEDDSEAEKKRKQKKNQQIQEAKQCRKLFYTCFGDWSKS